MKHLIMVVMVAMFATGCASVGDVEALQSQVSALESNDKVVASEISALKSKTNESPDEKVLGTLIDWVPWTVPPESYAVNVSVPLLAVIR